MSEINLDDIEANLDEVMGAEAAREESKGSGNDLGRRVVYLDQLIKGDEVAKAQKKDRVYLRYLTDFQANLEEGVLAWITVNVHTAVPTKPKPASWEKDRNWPSAMSAVCRKSKMFARFFPEGCYICDNYKDKYRPERQHAAPPRVWALAVQREPIIGDGSEELGGPSKKGRPVGYRDVEVEVPALDEEGKVVKNDQDELVTETVPQYIIVRQAYKNYFKPFEATAREYGTALDRDYLVIRDGEGTETTYSHTALNPIKIDMGDGEVIDFDLSVKDIREAYYPGMPRLTQLITSQVDKEYYDRWFIPQDDDDEVGGGTGTVAAPAAKSADADKDAVANLRERLKRRSKETTTA